MNQPNPKGTQAMKTRDKIAGAVAMLLMVAADQLTKLWAISALKDKPPVKIWENVFHFVYAENRGAAFSILQNKRVFLIIFTAVALCGVLYMLYFTKTNLNKVSASGLFMIVAGGMGNLIDRIFRAFVVDFIYFVPIDFPVFNVADCCVTIGTAVFVIGFIIDEARRSKASKTRKAED